jgi:hypothetical protein
MPDKHINLEFTEKRAMILIPVSFSEKNLPNTINKQKWGETSPIFKEQIKVLIFHKGLVLLLLQLQ